MSDDNEQDNEGQEEDPVVTHVEEQLDKAGSSITQAHLDEMKKQLDARLDALSRDKSKDDEEKSELRGEIDKLKGHITHLTELLESKSKEEPGETMLVAPENLNPRQQNDGVVQDEGVDHSQPQHHEQRKGWKRWV